MSDSSKDPYDYGTYLKARREVINDALDLYDRTPPWSFLKRQALLRLIARETLHLTLELTGLINTHTH